MEISEIVQIVFLVAFAMLALVLIILAVIFISSRKLNKEKLAKQTLITEHKEKLLKHTIETQEKERDRLAAEIHDEVTSKLNAIQMQLKNLALKYPDSTDQDKLSLLLETINTSIKDSRRIAYDLYPLVLERFGLLTALEELKNLNSGPSQKVTLETNITDNTFDQNSATNIYRIVQELLHNSIKHSGCSEISLSLAHKEGSYHLLYADNGKGNPEIIQAQGNMGLKNINARLSALGGTMDVRSNDPGLLFIIHFKENRHSDD